MKICSWNFCVCLRRRNAIFTMYFGGRGRSQPPDVGIAVALASPFLRKFGPGGAGLRDFCEIKFLNTKVCVFLICWKFEF